MLDPRTEAVLHAAAFGDLVDRTALDRVLAEDVEARDRFEQLQRLAGELRAMGAVDAPADLRPTVMQGITTRTMTTATGHRAAEMHTGETMSKKLMLGIAATVAAGLGLYIAMGGSLPPQGAEGTIGAAKRYQGQQMAASDVTLGDQALQSFLQSPGFDKLRRDPAARATFQKVATNASFVELIRSARFSELFRDAELSKVALNAELRMLLADAELAKLAADTQLQKAVSDADLRMAIADAEFSKLISDAELRQLVTNAEFAKLANDADLRMLLKDAEFARLMSDTNFRNLVTDADLRMLVSDTNFAKLMNDTNFRNLVNDAEFSKMSAEAFMSAVDTGLTSRKSGEGQKDF